MNTLNEDLSLVVKLAQPSAYPIPEFTEEEADMWLPDIMHQGDWVYSTEKKHRFIYELTVAAISAFTGASFCMVEGEYALLEDGKVTKLMNYTRLTGALRQLSIELADADEADAGSAVDGLLEAWESFAKIYGLDWKYDSETFTVTGEARRVW